MESVECTDCATLFMSDRETGLNVRPNGDPKLFAPGLVPSCPKCGKANPNLPKDEGVRFEAIWVATSFSDGYLSYRPELPAKPIEIPAGITEQDIAEGIERTRREMERLSLEIMMSGGAPILKLGGKD